MKLLKKLTKVISAVLASVAVFSVGFSASALDNNCAVFKTPNVQYNINKLPDGRIIIRNKEGKAKYGICFQEDSGRYYLVEIAIDKCLSSMDGCSKLNRVKIFDSDSIGSIRRYPSRLRLPGVRESNIWEFSNTNHITAELSHCAKGGSHDMTVTFAHYRGDYQKIDKVKAKLYTKGFSEDEAYAAAFLLADYLNIK